MQNVATVDMPVLVPSRNISERDVRFVNLLSRVASDIPNPVGNARLAACVVYRNEVVSFGVNELKTHPMQAKFGRNTDAIYLHAEISAIKNALRSLDLSELSRASMYVCRVKYFDQTRKKKVFGLARPCAGCRRCIRTFGIDRVIYTLDEEGIEKL